MQVIFECVYGSKLYGTSLPTSDDDTKGIFVEDLRNIVMKTDRETILTQGEGVDRELKEIRRFIKDACDGQTYALEMLFAPQQYWRKADHIWGWIQRHRSKLVSKSVMPFIGFAISQAQKYTVRGKNQQDLRDALEFVKGLQQGKKHLTLDQETMEAENLPSFITKTTDRGGFPVWNILGKEFQVNIKYERIIEPLQQMLDRYGERSSKSTDQGGVDWKAYYHSVRLLHEAGEYLTTGHITLPRPEAPHLMKIRLGEIPIAEVCDEVEDRIQQTRNLMANSTLPEKVSDENKNLFNDMVYNLYTEQVK